MSSWSDIIFLLIFKESLIYSKTLLLSRWNEWKQWNHHTTSTKHQIFRDKKLILEVSVRSAKPKLWQLLHWASTRESKNLLLINLALMKEVLREPINWKILNLTHFPLHALLHFMGLPKESQRQNFDQWLPFGITLQ